MKLVLVDTAGPVVGVAAFAGGAVVYTASLRVAAGAEAWLAIELERALVAVGDVERVAVTVGPGTFTGVRVGVAAALGLAFARGVDVVPLSSLALRAALVPDEPRVLALLDARKGKVYAGWFDTRGPVPVPIGPEQDLAPAQALAAAPGVAVGEGADVYAEAVVAAGHRLVANASDSPVEHGAALARSLEARTPERVGLRYLREPDARPSSV